MPSTFIIPRSFIQGCGLLLLIAMLSLAIFSLLSPAPTFAVPPNPIVDSTADAAADDGQCTLREAIIATNTDTASGAQPGECQAGFGSASITFSLPVSSTITLGSILPAITDTLTIDGVTASELTITNNFSGFTIFIINSGANVTLTRLIIDDSNGRGIENSGTLTVNNSTISDNLTGGGIRNMGGTVTVNNSTISGNIGLGGGGIYNGAGSVVVVNNSTISGNFAGVDDGGGIYNGAGSVLVVNNSTISDNGAGLGDGGGIFNESTGQVFLKNTILANNSAANQGPDCLATANFTSLGYNLIENTADCAFSPTSGDITGLDPVLASLADNGGPTFTHALLPASPAIGRIPFGANGCGAQPDQRGVARPQPANGPCDIGAYELVIAPVLNVSKTVDQPSPSPGETISYTIVVHNAGLTIATGVVISDTLPTGLSQAGPISIDPPPVQVASAGLTGLTIQSGQAVTVTIPAAVDSAVAPGTPIVNTAAVTSFEITTPVTDAIGITVVEAPPGITNTVYLPLIFRN